MYFQNLHAYVSVEKNIEIGLDLDEKKKSLCEAEVLFELSGGILA